MCLRFADMERKLGEIDRARAIYAHCSQICDPRVRFSTCYFMCWVSHDDLTHNNISFKSYSSFCHISSSQSHILLFQCNICFTYLHIPIVDNEWCSRVLQTFGKLGKNLKSNMAMKILFERCCVSREVFKLCSILRFATCHSCITFLWSVGLKFSIVHLKLVYYLFACHFDNVIFATYACFMHATNLVNSRIFQPSMLFAIFSAFLLIAFLSNESR